ncbi:hypothetical protein PAXRUDRAFT_836540, partial [Paxillus rubicundulus Ve08.2h10]
DVHHDALSIVGDKTERESAYSYLEDSRGATSDHRHWSIKASPTCASSKTQIISASMNTEQRPETAGLWNRGCGMPPGSTR